MIRSFGLKADVYHKADSSPDARSYSRFPLPYPEPRTPNPRIYELRLSPISNGCKTGYAKHGVT
ncbi:MAG: hypothetical protein ACAF41_21825 [Leptolyngbya sp. BL-A-14]